MRNFMLVLALVVLAFSPPASAAVPYSHVQADAALSAAPPGSRSGSLRIHLHNIGDIAASCMVKAGGRKQITGVSAKSDATIWFRRSNELQGL